MTRDLSMTLVGCGAMGGALLKGWLQADGLFSKVTVITPEKHTVDPFQERYPNIITYLETPDQLTTTSDVLIFGVKPQIMPQVIRDYVTHVTTDTLIMTIAAGLDLSFYEKALGDNKQIVRIMPNTPATISKAMSGLLANKTITPLNKERASRIMEAVGRAVFVESDEKLDRLTAISGCGPAYVFSLVEALEKAAMSLGFSTEDASLLARETVIGSAQYLAQTPSKSATDLRIQVTSPGGMTEAGLKVLQDKDRFNTLIEDVTKAAFKHAEALK
ncbi:MAG TPA: pyrroline-5-carboxylate reductase [Holosporales bacterium]|nr:pyrroline-5-carboxylate reductase [Holosporales bacterium]